MDRTSRPINDRKPWSRDELILALDLYCRIPFQKTKASNYQVQALAAMLQRTPASVARKLGNFGAFDPHLKKMNIVGLTHTSQLDSEIWREFSSNWAALVMTAHTLRLRFASSTKAHCEEIPHPTGPSERLVPTKTRLHQAFFREAVLSSYNNLCCVTGLPIQECLVASHIIPWSKNEKLRTDPTNGLCLSATFDRLFDRGLITISPDLMILVSKSLRRSGNPSVREYISNRHATPIIKPFRFLPNPDYLAWHSKHVFSSP